MTFVSRFDELHFYPCILYKFRVSQFSRFDLNYEKIQIIPTKYPKYAENDYGIFRGVIDSAYWVRLTRFPAILQTHS